VAPAAPAEGLAGLDALLADEWAARSLEPSPIADDGAWLRRASVDLLGRIPTEEEARAFLADGGDDKRVRAADRMLSSPEHARRLARWWEDVLLGPEVRSRKVDRGALRRWLEARFLAGDGWDAIVSALVTASGTSSAGGNAREKIMASDEDRAGAERAGDVNGAVNWMVRWAKTPTDLAGTASRAFLGVQIQCAQCHDHKTEAWKQTDFQSFAASFARVRIQPSERGAVFDVEDIDRPNRRLLKSEVFAPMALATPRALDGTDLSADGSPRARLAAWMVSRDNPWTSRAFVNRVWARLLGMGFVDPVDDLRPSSPPVAPRLLDALAEGFEASGWNVRALERAIVLSRAYAVGAAPIEGDVQDVRWSRFALALRALDEDALVDSLATAVDLERRLGSLREERAAKVRASLRRSIGVAFDEDAESNPTRFDGTIQQALLLMNAEVVAAGTERGRRSALDDVLARAGGDLGAAVDALFLRTLSRLPAPDEKERAVAAARADETALEDLFWALLNASEFALVR
jgi:hypothetical protein